MSGAATRRGGGFRAFLRRVAAALIVAACGSAAGMPGSGEETMELRAEVVGSPVVSGAALRVRTTVRNDGHAPLVLPDADGPSPLAFVVRDGAGRAVASGNAVDASVAGTELPPRRPNTVAVAAGASHSWDEDVSAYLGPPLPAGRFRLEVTLRSAGATASAAPTEFEVVALRPEAALRAGDASRTRITTAVLHRGPSGARTLFGALVASGGAFPGTLRPLFDAPADERASVALCLPPVADHSMAWAALAEPAGLRLARVRPYDSGPSWGPVPLPLRDTRLLAEGVPLPKGSAAFVVAGRDDRGPAGAVVTVTARGETHVASFRLPADFDAASACVAADLSGAAPRAVLAWVAGGNEVRQLGLDPAKPEPAPVPHRILRVPGRIVVLQADPPAADSPAAVTFVASPADAKGHFEFTRATVGAGDSLETTSLPEFPAEAGMPDVWLLPSANAEPAGPVLAGSAKAAWVVDGSAWRPAGVTLDPARHPRLLCYGVRTWWVSTWSARDGLGLTPLPPAAR